GKRIGGGRSGIRSRPSAGRPQRTRSGRREAWRWATATTSHQGWPVRRIGPHTEWRSGTAAKSHRARLAKRRMAWRWGTTTTSRRDRHVSTPSHTVGPTTTRTRKATTAASRATARTPTTVTLHPATAAVPTEPIRTVGATVTEDRAASARTRPPSAADAHPGGGRDLPDRLRLLRARPRRGSQRH